jgi:hypothetical protein
MKGEIMKTVKHEIKLERSVKIILAVFAVGIFLNAFATPIAQEMFGIKPALADMLTGYLDIYVKECRGC